MDKKLVERLVWRERVLEDGSRTEETIVKTREALAEAATALTLAQARIRELETALEPFANDWRAFPGCDPDGEPTKVTVADFKRARQAIKEAGE